MFGVTVFYSGAEVGRELSYSIQIQFGAPGWEVTCYKGRYNTSLPYSVPDNRARGQFEIGKGEELSATPFVPYQHQANKNSNCDYRHGVAYNRRAYLYPRASSKFCPC